MSASSAYTSRASRLIGTDRSKVRRVPGEWSVGSTPPRRRRARRSARCRMPSRVRRLITIDVPIYAGQHKPLKAGLTADDIATNEFLDPTISLPGK